MWSSIDLLKEHLLGAQKKSGNAAFAMPGLNELDCLNFQIPLIIFGLCLTQLPIRFSQLWLSHSTCTWKPCNKTERYAVSDGNYKRDLSVFAASSSSIRTGCIFLNKEYFWWAKCLEYDIQIIVFIFLLPFQLYLNVCTAYIGLENVLSNIAGWFW